MATLGVGTTIAAAGLGTAIAPGIGTLIGAGLGFVVDFGSWLSASANEKEADTIQAESDILGYQTSILQTKAQIDETKANISAYESFLSYFPNYKDLQKNTFEAQSRQEFKSLMNNFAMTNVAAGERGHVGGSAALFADEAKAEVVDYAGADMALGGGDGGRYEMAQTELVGSLDSQQLQAENQLGVLRSSLGYLNDTVDLYDTALQSAKDSLESLTQKKTPKKTDDLSAAERRADRLGER